jgi:hypothetical protein
MGTTLFIVSAVGLVMLVYIAVGLRSLVRMKRARMAALEAVPPDATHGAVTFAMLKGWYAGKDCAICHKPIPPLHHVGPKPGLLNPASKTHELFTWDEIPGRLLPGVLDTHLPICPNCETAESFRREFPHRVTERKEHAPNGVSMH